MNSKTYHQTVKETSKKLNNFFGEFCDQYPQYCLIKDDYTKKSVHLNGIQFHAGFASGPNDNWEDYLEIAVIIELVMIWAYKTKWILDKKQDVWQDEDSIMDTVLEHDLVLSCINDLFEQYSKKDLDHIDKIRSLVDELMGKLSYGFWLEKEKLNIKNSSLEEISDDWEKKYIERNTSLNLVYDYTPLIGFSLSVGNFDIIPNYLQEIPSHLRFSHASQMISDLGDFGQNIDKNAKSHQDEFSDIRNGIITFPVFKLIDENLIKEALADSREAKSSSWQEKARELISEKNINKEAIELSAKSYDAHRNFFESFMEKPSPILLKVFGMLINNKYFNQKVVFEQSPVLRNRVILCDKNGKELGTEDKLRAHQEGKLHKAFSIFIYNSLGEHLLQKRADGKYHSAGLWSNTCCSHNISGEKLMVTAERRLQEEMGFTCKLQKKFSFVYQVDAGNILIEHEYDTVLVGKYDGEVSPNENEVQDIRWVNIDELINNIVENPHEYTPWLKIILQRMGYKLKKPVNKTLKIESED